MLQASSYGRVLDRTVLVDVFNPRIGDTAVVFEERWQSSTSNVAAFIDCSGEDSTPEFTVPNRIIGAATEERDAERSAGYYHSLDFLFFRWTIETPRKMSAWS